MTKKPETNIEDLSITVTFGKNRAERWVTRGTKTEADNLIKALDETIHRSTIWSINITD